MSQNNPLTALLKSSRLWCWMAQWQLNWKRAGATLQTTSGLPKY